jgi:hypothetical protein
LNAVRRLIVLVRLSKLLDQFGKDLKMKKWIPSFLSLLAGAVTIFSPDLQAVIAAHPETAGVLASVVAIITHLLPSPTHTTTSNDSGYKGI